MNNKTPKTLSSLLDHLDQEGIAHSKSAIKAALEIEKPGPSNSLLVQILSGLGVCLATVLIILTLAAARILNEQSALSFFICGTLALALSYALSKSAENQTEHALLSEQVTLASLAVGKCLITAGFVIATDLKNEGAILWLVTGSMLALTTLTYLTLNSTIDRFFSPLITLCLAFAALRYGKQNLITPWLKFAIFYIPLLGAALTLMLNGKVKAVWQPLGFALLFFTCIALPLSETLNYGSPFRSIHYGEVLNLSLAAGFLTTAFVIAKNEKLLRPDLIIITLVLTALLAAAGPGQILAALTVLIIGYYRSSLTLIALGIISLIYFLIAYYYQLNITLLEKSGLLAVSGAGLLAVWAYLHLWAAKERNTL